MSQIRVMLFHTPVVSIGGNQERSNIVIQEGKVTYGGLLLAPVEGFGIQLRLVFALVNSSM